MLNFEDWYKENEAFLVAQPFTNYVAAAAWRAGQQSGREQAAKICDEVAGKFGGVVFGDFGDTSNVRGLLTQQAMADAATTCADSIRKA